MKLNLELYHHSNVNFNRLRFKISLCTFLLSVVEEKNRQSYCMKSKYITTCYCGFNMYLHNICFRLDREKTRLTLGVNKPEFESGELLPLDEVKSNWSCDKINNTWFQFIEFFFFWESLVGSRILLSSFVIARWFLIDMCICLQKSNCLHCSKKPFNRLILAFLSALFLSPQFQPISILHIFTLFLMYVNLGLVWSKRTSVVNFLHGRQKQNNSTIVAWRWKPKVVLFIYIQLWVKPKGHNAVLKY